jgi:hypothetical protein
VLALVAAGSAAPAAAARPGADPATLPAITGGAPDGDAHPYVATLLAPTFRSPNCTAVAVRGNAGTTVLLTDAHCVGVNGERSGPGVGISFAPTWTPTTPLLRGSFFVDPLFRPHTSTLHDLAAVVLAPGTVPATATLATPGQAEVAPGTALTVVGTGLPYRGQRRTATEIVSQVTPDWVLLGPGSGNSCDGDSGGPDLLPNSSTVVALTDQGSCTADEDTRVDTAEARWLATAATTAVASLGLREPSLLGMVAARDGNTVVIRGASKYLDITTGRWLPWVGDRIDVQRWTQGSWITIGELTTDRYGHLAADMQIPFRVGLRVTCPSIISVQGAVSTPVVL